MTCGHQVLNERHWTVTNDDIIKNLGEEMIVKNNTKTCIDFSDRNDFPADIG
jgi:hypothetical protein